MHILHVITTLNCGGAEAMLVKLVQSMAEDGVRSTVVSLMTRGHYGPVLERAGIPVYALGMRRGVPTPGAVIRFVRILHRERPDLVQTWMYHADLLGTLAAGLCGTGPVCWNLRCSNMEFNRYSRLTRWLVALLVRLSPLPATVLVNSYAGRRFHGELGYRPRVWDVVPNGFDTDLFRPDPALGREVRRDLGLEDGAPVIGLIARFDPMKDHATFLAAAQDVARRNPRVRFVLVGKDVVPANPAFAVAAGEPLAGRVLLLGQRNDVQRILTALDVVCLSSAFGEGFPNVLGEAMACGIPCVATDVGDAAHLVGETGLIVPPRQPVLLTLALEQMLAFDPAERARRGQAARRRILESFTVAAVARQYHDIYTRVLAAATR